VNTRAAAIAALLAVLAGCGGKDDDPPTPTADTVTLTVNGTTTSYADTSPGVTITAYTSGSNTVLLLMAPSPPLTFSIACPAPLPTSFPANDTCVMTYISSGATSENAAAAVTLTGLQTGLVGHFSGTFTNVVLNGTATVTVSGSFSSYGTL
jgi:hypothetical protein